MTKELEPLLHFLQHMDPEFLTLLFTPQEFTQLQGRLLILQALLEGTRSQRDISQHFGVSLGQITRGSNALKQLSPQKRSILKKLLLDYSGTWRA